MPFCRSLSGSAAFIVCFLSWSFAATPVAAQSDEQSDDGWWVFDGSDWEWAEDKHASIYSVAVMAGEGTESNFSDTVSDLFGYDGSGDKLIVASASREIFWFRDQFSIDGELMYGYHYDREDYHEVGAAVYMRWHEFPWNGFISTTFAVGVGPSYTTIYPALEAQDNPDDRSKVLNQFNLELTTTLWSLPDTMLLFRLQHRSGVFGALGGVWDGSNFLTVGLRQKL